MPFYRKNCTLAEWASDCKKPDCERCGFDKKVSESRRARVRILGLQTVGNIKKLIIPKAEEV